MQEVKALTRLHVCTCLSEPLLFASHELAKIKFSLFSTIKISLLGTRYKILPEGSIFILTNSLNDPCTVTASL